MTNKQKFFYNGLVLTVVGLAMRSVGLIFGAYISRTVGASGVGLNSLIMTVYGFAVTFATSGISLTVTKQVAEAIGREGSDTGVLKGAFAYSVLFGSLASVLLFFLADSLGTYVLGGASGARSLRILSLSLLPCAMSSVISGYFVGVKRVSFNAALNVLGQLLRIILTVALLKRSVGLGTEAAVFALCLGVTVTECVCFAVGVLEFVFDRLWVKRNKKRVKAKFCDVFSMALPLAFSAYIRSALLSVEHSLIPKRLRDRGESVGESLSSYGTLHGMALPLILYPLSPLSSFSGLLVPEFSGAKARGDGERMSRIATKAVNTTLTYSVIMAVFIYLFSEELGYVIYASYDAGFFISILAPVVPIMYLDHVTDSILKGIGEHVYSMWVNIFDAALSVALVYFLIPLMGISGYALVIIGMEAFNFAFSMRRLKKRISFCFSLKDSVIKPFLCASFAAAISKLLFVSSGSQTTISILLIKITVAVCTYICARLAIDFIRIRKEAASNAKRI